MLHKLHSSIISHKYLHMHIAMYVYACGCTYYVAIRMLHETSHIQALANLMTKLQLMQCIYILLDC